MKKLFAMLLALTMTFQLITPAWADAVGEGSEEVTEASEIVEEGSEEEIPEEETTEPTGAELPEETTEAPAEETEATEPASEEPSEVEAPITEEVQEEDPAPLTSEGALASGTCGKSVNWVLTSDGTLTISGTGAMEDYNTDSNTAPWYANRKDIVNVMVESGVTYIGAYAFYGCYKLASATLAAGVKTIGRYAFQDCKKLTSVTLSDGLQKIDYDAFSGCSGLANVTIPDSVTSIGSSAFQDCSSLTSVTIPDSVTSMGDHVFSGCSGLISVTIPDGVTSIEMFTFSGCSSLTGVTIPAGVTSIGWSAFSGCSSLTAVTIPDGVTSIDSDVFLDCSSLTSVTIPDGVTSIGMSAFYGCSSLTDVTIPESVTSMGWSVFSGCSSLTGIAIPEGITNIRSFTFSGCSSLTGVTIPDSVMTIEESAFKGCSSLTSVTIPEDVTSIEDSTFYGCSSLTSVTIPDGVTSIGMSAFYGCSSLTGVTIPENVKSIGYYAFSGCSSLTSVKIPDGLTSIAEQVFRNCSNLTSIAIPESVTSIGDWAFSGCSKLKDVYYGGTKADWDGISIARNNEPLQQASIHYQAAAASQIRPTDTDSLESGMTLKLTLWSPMQNKQLSAKWSLATEDEAYASIGSDGTLTAKAVTAPVQITVKAEPVTGEDTAEKVFWILPSTAGLDVLASGTCGTNVNWALTSDGTLTISGSGEMANYSDSNTAPWYDYRESIKNVLVKFGVTSIGNQAFSGCSELVSATLLPGVQIIGVSAFSGCEKLTNVNLPDGLKDIYSRAFYGCSSLTSVTIPKGLTRIKYQSFYGCSSLTGVTIPEGVVGIEDQAFYGCTSLTEMVFPDGMGYIGAHSLYGCTSLESVRIPKSVTNIGTAAFSHCINLTSVTLPEGVSVIESNAFSGCSKLADITLPKTVKSIGSQAFDGCSSLTGVTIPEGVTEIAYGTFKGCTSLTKVTIPQSVTSIENNAFEDCSSLISVEIPENVTSIGSSAFYGCSSLTSVTVPGMVTKIAGWTFKGCGRLTKVTIPEGVTSIEDSAFSDCSSLTSVTIPDGMTSIGGSVFSGCSSLTNVTIPESITSIGSEAFWECFSLKDVYYGGTKAEWNHISISWRNDCLLDAVLHYKGQLLPQIRPVDTDALDGGASLKLTLWSMELNKKIDAAWSLAEGGEAYAAITADGTLTAKAVAEPVEITVIAQPTNGEPSVTKTIRINPKATALLLMLEGEPLGETLDVDMYDRLTLPLTAIKNTREEAKGIRWSTSKKDVAQVDADGVITLLKPGTAVIQATDDGKLTGKVTLNVIYTDKSPRLGASTLNLNAALVDGVTVDFIEAYGNGVESLQWNDERFLFEYRENQLSVSAKDALKNGSYAVSLSAACADGRTYDYSLTVKVTNTLPKPTVKQTAKLNLFYKNSTAPLTVTVPGQTVTDVELTDTEDFALMPDGGNWEIVYSSENAKPDTKGSLNVYLEGYRTPVKVSLTVATVSTAPAVKLSAASGTINSGSALTTRVTLLDKSGKPLELENPGVQSDNAEVSIDGSLVTIALNEAKSTTVTMYLQDISWAKSVKLTHKITVSDKLPTLKPAGNLTLNRLFAQSTAETGMVLSQSNLTLVKAEAVPTAKEGTAAFAESEKLNVVYDPETGHMTAAVKAPDNVPKAGTYSFKCTGTLESGATIPGGTLKVTVSAAAPKVKLSAASVKLNKFLAGAEQGTVNVTVPAGYQVVDFTGKPAGMSFDEDTGILTVALESDSDNGGTYNLYPVVREIATGEEVTLPTKLSFKVQAYNAQKLGVTLSAKGKLDTQKDGEIAYTVTKLTNCLGTVDNMVLEGQDAELFQAKMDFVSGKPTIHLTLKSGETYATNKAYKLQFRFYACGQEILSPVQTVKVTQTALKVTAPKTITYYQAQKTPLRVALTANVPLEEVVLNAKTSKEFLAAVGDVTLEGDRLVFEITNPAALTAGKSYSVVLDATPRNNASNVKPVTVKLTVKVQK